MSRTYYDQFAKIALAGLLRPYLPTRIDRPVPAEVHVVDVYCEPPAAPSRPLPHYGLLTRLVDRPTLLEPFSTPPSHQILCGCFLKLLAMQTEWYRLKKKNNLTTPHGTLPQLWMIVPTLSRRQIHAYCGQIKSLEPANDELRGIYRLPSAFFAGFVVIHELPKTEDTVFIRILGRGDVAAQAVQELLLIPKGHKMYDAAQIVLYNYRKMLDMIRVHSKNFEEVIMKAYQWVSLEDIKQQALDEGIEQGIEKGIEQGIEKGIEKGSQNTLLKQLQLKFGPPSEATIARVRGIHHLETLENLAGSILTASSLREMGLE